MSNLSNPLSLEMIRNAATDIVHEELFWAKYGTEITEHIDGIIADELEELAGDVESEPVTDRDDVEAIVSEFCDRVAGELEMSRGNGLASDITYGDVIYTSDILDYYTENTNDVDEALADVYGDLSDFETIADAMAAGVALALENIAESEISEVMQAFETWASDVMVNSIFA